MRKHTGGGAFDPTDRHVYFLASNPGRLERAARAHDHLLVAVNEVESPSDIATVESWLDRGLKVFLDSGVFSLAMEHAKRHEMPHDQALALPPEEVDGFDRLFDRYCELVTRLGDRLWGYVEIDFGGLVNKRRTRARLEALGFRPIPVYHPFADGWDYFDELASAYDRICFGNIVQANRPTRKRLIRTAFERKRQYPDLWIHLLGLTPNEWLNAYPIDSGDSSSWLSSVRWSNGQREFAAGQAFGLLPRDFRYKLGSEGEGPTGHDRAVQMSGYCSQLMMRNWRALLADLESAGLLEDQ